MNSKRGQNEKICIVRNFAWLGSEIIGLSFAELQVGNSVTLEKQKLMRKGLNKRNLKRKKSTIQSVRREL